MEYLSTVEDLRELINELGLLTSTDFTRFVSLKPSSPDVLDAVQQLLEIPLSGVGCGIRGFAPVTPYHVARLDPVQRDGLISGNWLLHDELGAGGMGIVLSARDRTAPRYVAVKFLLNDSDAPRFEQEWRTLAQLSHPGLPTYHDSGVWDGGEFNQRPYFVMNYLDGQDLDQLVGTDLREQTVLRWSREIVDVLAYLHDLQFVHRDIKPSNIRRVNRSGRVVLMDLGLIKEPGADMLTDSQRLTAADVMMGTVDFMAPEQCVSTRAVTAAADIYSLGATIYCLLTGQALFTGNNLEKLQKIQFETPSRLRLLRPDCAVAFDDLIHRMLAKDPAQRPTTQELRAWFSNTEDTVLVIRGAADAGTSSAGLAANFRFEQRLIEFGNELAIGIHRLSSVTAGDVRLSGQHLETALTIWEDAIDGNRVPPKAQLIAIGGFLPQIEAALENSESWDVLLGPPVQDSLSKLYVNLLIFVADCLTEDYLSGSSDERYPLTELRQNIEARLADWAKSIAGGTPHCSYLDHSLCESLQGHYPVSLRSVIGKFDRVVLNRFQNAIRQRISNLARELDSGALLLEFVSNEAISFWHDDSFDGHVTGAFAAEAGECLSSLLEVIGPDTYQVLKSVPQTLKSLWLDDPDIRLQVHKTWSKVAKNRLTSQLKRISNEAGQNAAYQERLAEVQQLLNDAIDIPWIGVPSELTGFLVVRNDQQKRLPCRIIEITKELLGIHFRVSASLGTASAPEMPLADLDEIKQVDFETAIPIQFGEDGPLVDIVDCILEISLSGTERFVYGNLDPLRWGRGVSPPVTDVFVRGDAPEGNAKDFSSFLLETHGIVTTPAEKLSVTP